MTDGQWPGPPHLQKSQPWCYVHPEDFRSLDEALDAFVAQVETTGGDAWQAAFRSTVSLAASTILRHARPPFVQVRLLSDQEGITALLRESGRSWLGEPGPESVLDGLADRPGTFFDTVTHELVGNLGNRWLLRRRVETVRRTPAGPDVVLDAGGSIERLVRAATRIAETPHTARIPLLTRSGPAGDIARTLRALRRIAREREGLATTIQQAPIGICAIGPDARYWLVNPAYATLYRYGSTQEMIGRLITDDMERDVQSRNRTRFLEFWQGNETQMEAENALIAPLRGPSGHPESMVLFIGDDAGRSRRQQRLAARIQRRLLPAEPLAVGDYQVAGGCMPARDFSGDLFDWQFHGDRWLDLSIGDVMGKGMGAALLMAGLRTALRAAGPEAGPAERARTASDAMTPGHDVGVFVTLFHARLEIATGRFRYADAGHGHWAILRADGRLEHPPAGHRSLPLLALPDTEVREHEGRLDPGDTLVLYSDGLVERDDRITSLERYRQDLDEAEDAESLVRRLLGRVPPRIDDDVTVVALRRRAG